MTKEFDKKGKRGKVQNRLMKKVPDKVNKGASYKSIKALSMQTKKTVLKPANNNLAKPHRVSQDAQSMAVDKGPKQQFPSEFPFWARLKIGKHRTTLVIDEDQAYNKRRKRFEDGYVNREATHTYKKDYEEISPNPDKDDCEPMYLKRPTKKPKRMFEPHNKSLSMPQFLIDRYSKNNKK